MYMENTRDRVSSKLQRINGGRNEIKRIERTTRAQSKQLEENVSASVDISPGSLEFPVSTYDAFPYFRVTRIVRIVLVSLANCNAK